MLQAHSALIDRCGCYETSFYPTAGDESAHLEASTNNIRAGEAALSKRTVTDPVRGTTQSRRELSKR
jgi:hypothetical protein